jgi:RNA polymerase sigma factor (sigma-70 family)
MDSIYREIISLSTQGGVSFLKSNSDTGKEREFDYFCKKVLRNEVRKFHNETKRQRVKHFSELSAQEKKHLCVKDDYFNDEQIFIVQGLEIVVKNNCIAKALQNLPERKRDIIILSYFLELTDREIGERLNLIRATVQYQRRVTLQLLKKIMKGGQADEEEKL